MSLGMMSEHVFQGRSTHNIYPTPITPVGLGHHHRGVNDAQSTRQLVLPHTSPVSPMGEGASADVVAGETFCAESRAKSHFERSWRRYSKQTSRFSGAQRRIWG